MTELRKWLYKELEYLNEDRENKISQEQQDIIVERFINSDYIWELIDTELMSIIENVAGSEE